MVDAKASKAFHCILNGVGSIPISRKMTHAVSYFCIASRVEAWQSVPLISFHLPGCGGFFLPGTSVELFVTKPILAILVSLLFLIGNHLSSHNERRRARSGYSSLRLSVRSFWNTQTFERLSLNFKWRETKNNTIGDQYKKEDTQRPSVDQRKKERGRDLLDSLKLTNRIPAAWRSPVRTVLFGKTSSHSLESRKTTRHWLSVLFFLLLVSNSVGLIPLFSAITGRAGFTLGLSIALLSAITLRGVKRQGIQFPRLFLPSGPSWPIAPLFILLESISFAFRAISLGTRLYCNLFAGHLLLHLFTSLCLVPVVALPLVIGAPITRIVATILIALSALESIVVVLQSGVFCLLTSFYLTEVLSKKDQRILSKKETSKKIKKKQRDMECFLKHFNRKKIKFQEKNEMKSS